MGMRIRRRPEEPIRDVRRSDKAEKAEADQRRNGIDKTATLIASKSVLGEDVGLTHPTDEQLAVINGFTRSPKSAEELVVFDTMSCNDLVDRDDDYFKTDTVKAFAKLPAPFSPVGKSFMVSHDYSKLPVGRIFDVGNKQVEVDNANVQFLTNSVFMPNTAQYKSFIENMDFGIYWAVSVGVVLNDASCEVGQEHPWGWSSWFCSEGHEKGFSYDPESDEEDSWGWPLPVDDNAKGAVRCVRAFGDPRDFYELSMCFLGAQYLAELSKDPAFSGISKTASAFKADERHLFALGSGTAEKLPVLHVPERVKEAMAEQVKTDFDSEGRTTWVDSANMVWQFDPEAEDDPEAVMCLGEAAPVEPKAEEDDDEADKAAHGDFSGSHSHEHAAMGAQGDDETHTHEHTHDNDAVHDHGHENDSDEDDKSADPERLEQSYAELQVRQAQLVARISDTDHADLVASVYAAIDAMGDAIEETQYEQAAALRVSAEASINELSEALGEEPGDETAGGEMSKKVVLAAVKAAGLPSSFYEKLAEDEEGNGLDAVLSHASERIKGLEDQVQTLATKAEMGEAYLKDLRADVRKSFVRAYQEKGQKVSTGAVDKLIKLADDDVELLKELKEQYDAVVHQRFKRPTVESAVQEDIEGDDEHDAPSQSSPTLHSRVRIPGEQAR